MFAGETPALPVTPPRAPSEFFLHIPADIIERRYYAGLRNFFRIFAPIVDKWILADNSYSCIKIADFDNDVLSVYNDNLYKAISNEQIDR